MPCECPACRRDEILNGTLVANCASCQSPLSKDNPFQIMGDKSLVCDKCVVQHYVTCVNCQKLHKKENCTPVKTEDGQPVYACNRCFAQFYRMCSCCNERFDRHNVMTHNDIIYCRPCFNKNFQTCTHCSAIKPFGSMKYKIRKNQIVCDGCYGFYGPIGTYDTKPKIAFHGRPPHYFGIELEVELANQDKNTRGFKAKECMDLLGEDFCIVKDDGSLQCGFEIVTQPASIESQKEHWDKFFLKQPENLVSFNSSGGRCGLHIHCAKVPLSLLTIAKIVVFVNDEKNTAFVELIAGRKPNNYFQISKKKYGIAKHAGNMQRNQRYEAVNLVNEDTIEFRLFKGTLKKESFYKALEFCDALIHFCAAGEHGITYCRKVEHFIDYVGLRSKDYPNLWAFILAKVLQKETKLTKECGFAVKANEADSRQC